MFEWIKTTWQNIRIACAYPEYENEKRQAHIAEAERRFSTAELSAECAKRMRGPQIMRQKRFTCHIDALQLEIAALEAEKNSLQSKLDIFEYPYQERLSELFSELKDINEHLQDAYSEKQSAHSRLQSAKDDIARWHWRAESRIPIWGNRGKRLPKHSLFGQSYGDLDGYKSDRDDAYHDVRYWSGKIHDLKSDKESVKKRIASLKSDRQMMFDLKSDGWSQGKLERRIETCRKKMVSREAKRNTLQQEDAAFMAAQRHFTGVDKLEAQIKAIEQQKACFILQFDAPENLAARKQAFREIWLAEHA